MKASIIQSKIPLEEVEHVFGALISAFHPDDIGEDGPDQRFLALWTLFLQCAGWNEDEYWDAIDAINNDEVDMVEEKVSEKN